MYSTNVHGYPDIEGSNINILKEVRFNKKCFIFLLLFILTSKEINTKVHILNSLLSIKVPLKVACS